MRADGIFKHNRNTFEEHITLNSKAKKLVLRPFPRMRTSKVIFDGVTAQGANSPMIITTRPLLWTHPLFVADSSTETTLRP